MSVQALAEQFVAALEQLGDRVATERKADWVVIAPRLVLLRSRLLFPENAAAAADAEQDAINELRRIVRRGWMRMATHWLGERPQLGVDVFARPAAAAPAREGGYVALMEACLVALRGREGARLKHRPTGWSCLNSGGSRMLWRSSGRHWQPIQTAGIWLPFCRPYRAKRRTMASGRGLRSQVPCLPGWNSLERVSWPLTRKRRLAGFPSQRQHPGLSPRDRPTEAYPRL